MSHVTRMHESCHTHAWVMSHACMSHVTRIHESCHTHAWVMSHTCMSHVTHMHVEAWHESCRTHNVTFMNAALIIWLMHLMSASTALCDIWCDMTHAWVMTHLWVLHWDTCICDMTHAWVWHDSCLPPQLCELYSYSIVIVLYDMTHEWVWHSVPWLTSRIDSTHAWVWHNELCHTHAWVKLSYECA